MSVWIASREIIAARAAAPAQAKLLDHVKQLGDLEAALNVEFSAPTRQVPAADSALTQLERDLSEAGDEFTHRLTSGAEGAVEVTDLAALSRESARLKAMLATKTFHLREKALTPMKAWVDNARNNIEPTLAGARELGHNVRDTRPVIMVVDDDEVSVDILARAIDTERYETIFASDSLAALNQLRHVRPGVILMDIRLPGLDGVAFTRNLKAAPHLAGIPVIMFSGDARRETLLKSIEAGAADFIVKPVTREALNSKLAKLLSRSV
ncbi:MAG: response regulator [Steroidobacteraceae bacterium]